MNPQHALLALTAPHWPALAQAWTRAHVLLANLSARKLRMGDSHAALAYARYSAAASQGRGFKAHLREYSALAQLGEHSLAYGALHRAYTLRGRDVTPTDTARLERARELARASAAAHNAPWTFREEVGTWH